jgi:hypothetical protein
MAAATAMQCKHLPNGGIQWFQVMPRMCSIGQCAPHRTTTPAIRMAIEIASDSPAFFVVIDSLFANNVS